MVGSCKDFVDERGGGRKPVFVLGAEVLLGVIGLAGQPCF